jgi:hypothetical protein
MEKEITMFYAMKFLRLDNGNYVVRSVRTKGYKSLESAKQALVKQGIEGFVKKLGSKEPVWRT